VAQYNFGVGQLFIVPPGANPTPVNVGTLKDVSLDISRDVKELIGANAFPEDVALGKGKISGKAKSGRIQAALIASILAGSTTTTGQTAAANNELSTIPGTPYSVTALNGATFVQDGGVYDYTAGKWLTLVAPGTPASGQYTVTSAGVYTFAAADTTHSIGLFYTYTLTTGNKVALTNPLMGAATIFQLNCFNTYGGKQFGYTLYAVVMPKLSLAAKQDDYTETDIEFQGFTDSLGRVISVFTQS
jgi:hypothetical protein